MCLESTLLQYCIKIWIGERAGVCQLKEMVVFKEQKFQDVSN